MVAEKFRRVLGEDLYRQLVEALERALEDEVGKALTTNAFPEGTSPC